MKAFLPSRFGEYPDEAVDSLPKLELIRKYTRRAGAMLPLFEDNTDENPKHRRETHEELGGIQTD